MQFSEKNRKNEDKGQGKAVFKQFGERLKEKLREKDEKEVRGRLRYFVDFALCSAIAFVLCRSRLFFGTFPVSIALAATSRDRLLAVALGITAAGIDALPAYYVYACLAVLMLRVLAVTLPRISREATKNRLDKDDIIKFNPSALGLPERDDMAEGERQTVKLFAEKLYIRAICSSFGGLLCGILYLIEYDYSFYAMCQTLILTFLTPIITVALGGYFGKKEGFDKRYTYLSLALIMFLSVYASASIRILGMPLSPILAMLLTLLVSSRLGVIAGVGASIICGLAFELLYIPMLALSAVLFCLISAVKKNAGIAAVSALSLLYCYYIGGSAALVSVLPPTLVSIPIYMLADRYHEMMNAPFRRVCDEAYGLYFAEAVTEKTKNEAVKVRLVALEEVFSSISETFYKLSDRFRRPDVLGIRKIADDAFDSVCKDCKERERCWGSHHESTLSAIGCATERLHTKGMVRSDDLPKDFVARCVRCDRIVDSVNDGISRSTERVIKSGKMNFFASNYDDITAILKDALEADDDEYKCYSELGDRVFDYIVSCGIQAGGVAVYGKRCKSVVAKKVILPDSITPAMSKEMRIRISEIVGVEMSDPILEVGKDGNIMRLHSRPASVAVCAHGRLSAAGREWSSADSETEKIKVDPFEDEECCGDMTDAFITENSYFYSLISDGMGSGAEAAYISGVCAMFIEKMLSAGNRADITLRMLNNVIRNDNMGCGRECSATVDLLEIDLMSGCASFIKSGAAPTYIAREGTVYKVSSRTMPVGIIKDADARITKFDTKKGDIIVMISDGCCHDSDDCPWLVEYLCAFMSRGKKHDKRSEELCETMKNEILHTARKHLSEGTERDDISVSVTVVG